MSNAPVRETNPDVLFPEHPLALRPLKTASEPLVRILVSNAPDCAFPMIALYTYFCVEGRCRCDDVYVRIEACRLADFKEPERDWADARAALVLDLECRTVRVAQSSRDDAEAEILARQVQRMLTNDEWHWIAADRQRTRVLWAVHRSGGRAQRRGLRRMIG